MEFTLYYIKMTDKSDSNKIFYKIGYSTNIQYRIKVLSKTKYSSSKQRCEYNIELLFTKNYDNENDVRSIESGIKKMFKKYIVKHELSKHEIFSKDVLSGLFTFI